jgi:hypothetical protein
MSASIVAPLAGRGVGVLISVVGLTSVATTLIALNVPPLRRVKLDLPDHDAAVDSCSKQHYFF